MNWTDAERRTLICALRGWERHFLSHPALMESPAGIDEMARTRQLIERLQEEDIRNADIPEKSSQLT